MDRHGKLASLKDGRLAKLEDPNLVDRNTHHLFAPSLDTRQAVSRSSRALPDHRRADIWWKAAALHHGVLHVAHKLRRRVILVCSMQIIYVCTVISEADLAFDKHAIKTYSYWVASSAGKKASSWLHSNKIRPRKLVEIFRRWLFRSVLLVNTIGGGTRNEEGEAPDEQREMPGSQMEGMITTVSSAGVAFRVYGWQQSYWWQFLVTHKLLHTLRLCINAFAFVHG